MRRPWSSLFGVGVLVVVVLAIAWAVQWGRDVAAEVRAREQFRLLSYYILENMVAAGSKRSFPETLSDAGTVVREDGRLVTVQALLTDERTGKRAVYRAVTAAGDQVPHDLNSHDRFILWSAEVRRDGTRLILVNDLSVQQLPDRNLDFQNQRILSWAR